MDNRLAMIPEKPLKKSPKSMTGAFQLDARAVRRRAN